MFSVVFILCVTIVKADLVAPHDICNAISCITVDKLFFVEDSSVVCPFGYLKVAYKDQAGKFRVASAKTNKDRRSIDSRLAENCERIGATPHYMIPTVSSLQKIKTSKNQRKTPTETKSTTTKTTTTTRAYVSLDISSILTEDESFRTASCSVSLEDLQYLNNKLPYSLFDDTGDAIYGTGLVAALLSFIFTLVKLLAKNRSAHVQPNMPKPNEYSSPRPVNSTAAQQGLSFLGSAKEHIHHALSLPVRERQNEAFDIIRLNSLPVQVSAPVRNTTTAIPLPFEAPVVVQQTSNAISVPTVNQINEVQDYRSVAWCGCSKGKCISGNCRCHKAKRACGPLCHGGKVNVNCKATLDRVFS